VRQGENVVADPDEEKDVPGTEPLDEADQVADLEDDADLDDADVDDADVDDADVDDADEFDEADGPDDGPEADGSAGAERAGSPDEDGASASSPLVADLELESEIAADYIEGLLDVADLDGDIDMDVEGERAFVSVVGATLDELVGQRGEVLEALQELTRLAVHRQTGMRTRMMLDVGGYRQRRRTELAETGRDAADEVKRTGEPKRLWPMNPFERKIVHDAVAAAGLRSESEGEEPARRVVVLPAG
jgi:spoIIIJ-associated protein